MNFNPFKKQENPASKTEIKKYKDTSTNEVLELGNPADDETYKLMKRFHTIDVKKIDEMIAEGLKSGEFQEFSDN